MLDQQMVTTILTGVGVLLGLSGYLHGIKKDLTTQVDKVAAEAKADSKVTREDMRTGFAEVGKKLDMLEQRTFDLSTRLPPTPAATGTSDS